MLGLSPFSWVDGCFTVGLAAAVVSGQVAAAATAVHRGPAKALARAVDKAAVDANKLRLARVVVGKTLAMVAQP